MAREIIESSERLSSSDDVLALVRFSISRSF